MKTMKDIEKLLNEAEHGKSSTIFERITDEAAPFWEGCLERLQAGKKIRPYVVHRLLREQYNIKISESAIRNYFHKVMDEQ